MSLCLGLLRPHAGFLVDLSVSNWCASPSGAPLLRWVLFSFPWGWASVGEEPVPCPLPLPRLFPESSVFFLFTDWLWGPATAADKGVIRWFMLTTINRAHYFPGNRQDDARPRLLFSGHNWFLLTTLSGSCLNHIDVCSSKWCLWCLAC